MTDLFKYIRDNGDNGYGYSIDEALYGAKNAGLVETVKYVGQTRLGERRWGTNVLSVYELDDKLIGIVVYEMHGEDADDLLEDVYEVESYEVMETKFRRKNG